MLNTKNFNEFMENGFIEFPSLLNVDKCKELYDKIYTNRNWGKDIFRPREECEKNPQLRKVNPGKNINNLAEKFDLSFIEDNETIKYFLNHALGENYEIILKKFVVAACNKWLPDWLKDKLSKSLISNLGSFIKEEYRDVTYFRGIDYHLDVIDFPKGDPKFLTMYIYLRDVIKDMSPLNVVKKSFINGPTPFPHYIINDDHKDYLEYGKSKETYKRFEKKELTGTAGTVYFWTSTTLHGTRPQPVDDNFRISLRYLIKKKTSSRVPIDDLIKEKIIVKTRHEDDKEKKKILK
jgi:hypothetical protein